MERDHAIVELKFADHGTSLYGAMRQMNQVGIVVQLLEPSMAAGLLAHDTEVEMTVAVRTRVFQAATRIENVDRGLVRLRFTGPVRTIERRKELRLPVEIDVAYRAIHSDVCAGPWKHGVSRDLSFNGLRLEIESGPPIPNKLELMFALPDSARAANLSAVFCAEEEAEPASARRGRRSAKPGAQPLEKPVRATGRVTNCRTIEDGNRLLGLAFTVLSALDRMRLVRYLTAQGC